MLHEIKLFEFLILHPVILIHRLTKIRLDSGSQGFQRSPGFETSLLN